MSFPNANVDRLAPDIRVVVEAATTRARRRGATALLVIGSHARGTASRWSDLDLICFGDGPEYQLEVIEETLVSWSWRTPAMQRTRLLDPNHVVQEVPAWRASVVVFDDLGDAATMLAFANNWSWGPIGDAVVDWLSVELAGLAEEVLKIVAAEAGGDVLAAAVQTRFLATRLLVLNSVSERQLVASENDIWATPFTNPVIKVNLQHALTGAMTRQERGEISPPARAVLHAYLAIAASQLQKCPDRDVGVIRFAVARVESALHGKLNSDDQEIRG